MKLGDLVSERKAVVGSGEPVVLSVSERLGIVPQASLFNRQIALKDLSKYRLVLENDLVYNPFLLWNRAVGACFIPGGGCVSPAYVVLEPHNQKTARLLHYVLRSERFGRIVDSLASGTVTRRRTVPIDQVLNIELGLPDRAQQEAFADVLSALDDKIESNRRIVKQLDLLLLAHSNSLSILPRVALNEVSKSYRRPVNPLVLGEKLVDHFSLPAFDVAAMPERCLATSIMSGKFGVETTSVLISRLNPGTPRVWCAHVREVPAMCSSEFLVLEPLKKSSIGALWLAAIHPTLGEQMVQRATGTSFSHQRIKSADALSVEVPDIRLIDEEIRAECDELIEMVGNRRSENEHLSRFRDALLPELLSGRLRVKDAESMMLSR